jgi:hypothetical protein
LDSSADNAWTNDTLVVFSEVIGICYLLSWPSFSLLFPFSALIFLAGRRLDIAIE